MRQLALLLSARRFPILPGMEKGNFAKTMKGLPRVYWIVVMMEFFERGAYYGLMAVLSAYLALSVAEGGLGF